MAWAAPVVGFVAGALGLGAVGTAVAQLAIGVGVSLLATKLTAKKGGGGGSTGQQLSLKIEPDADRRVILGRAAEAGSLTFWQLSGSSNSTLRMVIDLADHECQGLHTTIWCDGKIQTWNPETKVVSGYGGNLKVHFYNGTAGQMADAGLISSSGGRWTSFDRGAHVAYAIIEATYNETDFPSGIPKIVFVVDGAKLYDQRKDSTAGGTGSHRWGTPSTYEFSANPAVIAHNVLRGVRPGGLLMIGMNAPAEAVRYADFLSAANSCDEPVPLFAGGDEPRYQGGIVASSFETNGNILERVLATMAGELIEVGGIYRIMAGVTQSIVASLTDEDLIVSSQYLSDPRRSRLELVNAVSATFSDPFRSYASVPLPLRFSSEDQAEDGGHRLFMALDLGGVTSRTQAQRIMEIERRRARRQHRISFTLRAKWLGLEPGDWIELNSARRGIVDKTFEVLQKTENEDLTIEVLLQETDSAIDEWTVFDEIADGSVIDLGPAAPPTASVSGLALTAIVFSSDVGGIQRPGLMATWTPVTDPTVDALLLEYRRVGDTSVIERRIADPTAGVYRWSDGVQGGTIYEARLRPVTVPVRGTIWTNWEATSVTAPQVVPVSETAILEVLEGLPEGSFGLSEQERIELALVTARDIQGSVTARLTELREDLERVAATSIGAAALMSRQVEQVRRTVNGSTVTVTEIKEVTDELVGRWAIVADVDGRVLGAVELATGLETSSFRVLANSFSVSDPAEDDLTPFVVIPGQGIFLDGVFVKDGSLTAEKINALELSAITANLGDVTAGKLRRPDNTFVIDLDAKTLRIDF